MLKGRVLYVPETSQGRSVFLAAEIPVRAEDVAMDARRPGTRVRLDLTSDDDDVRASNVRRTREMPAHARRRSDPGGPSTGGGSG